MKKTLWYKSSMPCCGCTDYEIVATASFDVMRANRDGAQQIKCCRCMRSLGLQLRNQPPTFDYIKAPHFKNL